MIKKKRSTSTTLPYQQIIKYIKLKKQKKSIKLYRTNDDELKLLLSYNEIKNFVKNCDISLIEEEICLYIEEENRKMKNLILNKQYELDSKSLQIFNDYVASLKVSCQTLIDQLEYLLVEKDHEDNSLELESLTIDIICKANHLYHIVNQIDDYKMYIKTKKGQKVRTLLELGLILGSISIASYTRNSFQSHGPYKDNQLVFSNEEINHIKNNLKTELTGKIPESSLEDSNINNYYLLNSIYENELLDDHIKETFYDLITIIEENPYLDKNKSYQTLSKLKYLFREKAEQDNPKVLAQFLPNKLLIEDFCKDQKIQEHIRHHENIHALFNNKAIPTFLQEGVTELLNREYLDDDPYSIYTGVHNYFDMHIYIPEITTIKLLCDLVGSDVVLKAYTKSDIHIIYEALEKIIGTKSDAKVFINCLDREIEKFKNESQIEYTFDSEYVFKWFFKYRDAKFNDKNKKDNISNKMNFDYNLSILRYIYNNEDFFNQYEELVITVGVLEKAYFCDELISLSSNQIVKYKDRIIFSPKRLDYDQKILKK